VAIKTYEFSQAFQLRLLSLLVQEPGDTLGFIEAQYFTGHPVYVEIARVAISMYKKYMASKMRTSGCRENRCVRRF